jgi:hypothetical protein
LNITTGPMDNFIDTRTIKVETNIRESTRSPRSPRRLHPNVPI